MATVFKRTGSKFYSAAWKDADGKRVTRTMETTDREAAKTLAAQLEKEDMLRRRGIIDVKQEELAAQSKGDIESHLKVYEATFPVDSDPKHVGSTLSMIRKICQACGFTKAADLAADPVNVWQQDAKRAGASNRKIQAYLTAMKGFSKWLANNGRIARDVMAIVKKPNPKTDRRRERRMLLPEEWHWLRSAVAGDRYGVSSDERVLLYATAIQTGLRSSELRSLTRGKLFLNVPQPYVICKAATTKNAKDARQYIQPELAEELKAHVAAKMAGAKVFRMPDEDNVPKMLAEDIDAAREAWIGSVKHDAQEQARRRESDFLAVRNHEGEVLDFHALRHTCGAWLAMAGAHPKAVQAVMRHCTITLTMDTYGHLFPGQEAETIARLPSMFQRPALAATGTTGVNGLQRICQRDSRQSSPMRAADCEPESAGRRYNRNGEPSDKSFQVATLDDDEPDLASIRDALLDLPPEGKRMVSGLIRNLPQLFKNAYKSEVFQSDCSAFVSRLFVVLNAFPELTKSDQSAIAAMLEGVLAFIGTRHAI